MRRTLSLSATLALALWCGTSAPAFADGCSGPCVAYALDYEFFNQFLNSDNGWYHDVYPNLESILSFKAGNGLALNTDVMVEPVKDLEPGRKRVYGDVGAYFKALNVSYETDDFRILAGQFEPNFGIAWDVAPGLYGSKRAEDYELTDRVGAAASYFFNAGGFHNQATASLFTLDRSFLSGSILTSRPTNRLTDGGAGNTKGLSSVALTLTGCKGTDPYACYDDGKFGYQVGILFQRNGEGDYGNETGVVGSLNKTIKLSAGEDLKLLGEVVWFKNFEGTNEDVVYATASTAYDVSDYTFSVTGTQRAAINAQATNDTFIDVSAVYHLGKDVSLAGENWSVGVSYDYDYDRASDLITNAVALQFKAELESK